MSHVSPEQLKERLLAHGVLETDVHREFAGGQHGQKLNLDMVQRGSSLYRQMIRAKGELIKKTLSPELQNIVVVGIDSGTNQSALDLADWLGGAAIGVETRKIRQRQVVLTQIAKRVVMATRPNLILLDEDVGTEGTVCARVVLQLRSLGVDEITAFHTWQRQPNLPKLDQLDVPYHPVIFDVLPSYNQADCKKIGYCAANLPLAR